MIKHQTRIILAGMLGNLIEAFDMTLCGLLSIYLAKHLTGSTTTGLLVVFFTFFAGYLARPIGAVTLGIMSDAYGRKITLAVSILSMGIATALIGLIPPNSSIGIASIIILLILRIIQSFSCGAEYLNTSAYLIENAAPNRKGYTGSWAAFGTMSGKLIASVVVLATVYIAQGYPEFEWIVWRLPFLIALLGSAIGLYIRVRIPESLEYVVYYSAHPKPKLSNLVNQSLEFIRLNKLKSLYVFTLSCLGVTTTVQIYIYGPTQAHLYKTFSDYQIILANIVSLIVLLTVFPIVGKLSDRISREKIVVSACFGFLILSQPFFHLLSYGSYPQFMLIQCLISIPAAAYYATVPVMMAEMFPLNLRCTVLSVLYSFAASLAAGLTPLLSLLLIKKTHIASSPSILIFFLVACTLSIIGLQFLKHRNQISNSDSALEPHKT